MKTHDFKPIIVVGFGNNGTRVACWYLEAFSVHMESRNDKMDFPPAGDFGRKWLWRNIAGDLDWDEIHSDFYNILGEMEPVHLAEIPYGFKLAVGMVIPHILHELGARIVHVIRDPRDVTKERKEQWASKHASEWGDGDISKLIPKSIKDLNERYNYIWAKANMICADYCEKNMPNDYLRVMLEDLVLFRGLSLQQFMNFLNMEWKKLTNIKKLDQNRLQDRMGKGNRNIKYAEIAMKRFGYL